VLAPKLKAWRLFPATTIIDGSAVRVSVLRDGRGKLIGIAKTPSERQELESQWNQWNRKTETEDLPVAKTLRKKLHSAIVKLNKQGFKYRMRFGGVRLNRERGDWEYCRWEVWKATPWKRDDFLRVNFFFSNNYVKEPLGVYGVVWKGGQDKPTFLRVTSRRVKAGPAVFSSKKYHYDFLEVAW
jgi:hypothetical protein